MTNKNNVRRQGIYWLLTIPSPNEIVLGIIGGGTLPAPVVCWKGQLERGGETGYEHYQCLVAFSCKQSLSSVTRIFGKGIFAELSRSAAANEYVCKEDTRIGGPWEFGVMPVAVNQKHDWELIWKCATEGSINEIPASIRFRSYRTILAIQADYQRVVGHSKEVFVYWGRTGTGKSRMAWEDAGFEAYPKDPRSKFWDGYQDQKAVVIDEFRGGIDIAHMLRWLDCYPVRVEIKGSSRPLCAERIWITSNLDPRSWYADLDADTLAALLRRMKITHFP